MKNIFVLSVLVILFFYSCKRTCLPIYTVDNLKDKYKNKVFGLNSHKSIIKNYRDRGIDSITAGYYVFYDNGNLHEYIFYNDLESYKYKEVYDINGCLINVIGKPLVRKIVYLDSLNYTTISCHFSDLNKKYYNVSLMSQNQLFSNLTLKEDSIFTNTKFFKFGYSCAGLKERKFEFVISYEYSFINDKNKHKCTDTFTYNYNCNTCELNKNIIDTSIVILW